MSLYCLLLAFGLFLLILELFVLQWDGIIKINQYLIKLYDIINSKIMNDKMDNVEKWLNENKLQIKMLIKINMNKQ